MAGKRQSGLKDWCEKVEQAEKYRDEKLFYDRWATWNGWLRGITTPENMPYQLLTWSLYKTFVPRVYFRDPYVVVNPTRPNAYYQAKVLEKVDNILIRKMKIKQTIKKMIGNAWWKGIGLGKHGYHSEFGFPKLDEEEPAQKSEDFQDKKGNLIEYQQKVSPGYPWFLSCKPERIVIPIGFDDFDDIPWIGMWYIRHIDDVKADDRYSNTSDLEPNYIEKKIGADSKRQKGLEKYVILYEVRDFKEGKIFVFTKDHKKYLMDEADGLQIIGNPFSPLIFNDDLDQIYGVPDVKYLETKQKDLNEVDYQIDVHRRLTAIKMLYEKGVITKDELGKLMGSTPVAGVEVKDINKVKEFKVSGIPSEFITAKEMIKNDMRETVGFSKAAGGDVLGKTHLLSEEFQQAGAGTEIRISERGDMVADLVETIVRKTNTMIFELWTEPQLIPIVGPELTKYWLEVKGSDLRGDYTYEIDTQEAVSQSVELRHKLAENRFKALADFAQPVIGKEGQVLQQPIVDAVELVRQYLESQGPSAERVLINREQGPMSMGDFVGKMQQGQGKQTLQ